MDRPQCGLTPLNLLALFPSFVLLVKHLTTAQCRTVVSAQTGAAWGPVFQTPLKTIYH